MGSCCAGGAVAPGLKKEWKVCRARQFVMLVLFVSLAAACGQATESPSPGDSVGYVAPTYTPYPTQTPYPTYTPPSPSVSVESLVWPNGPRDDVIPWTDAADFVGTETIVEGTVVRTYNSSKAVFLNFVEDYQGTFSVVIFPDDWSKFPRPPETLFYGRRIRVQGLVEEYQGAPEIVVRDPWQIEVALTLGQEEACDCGTPVVVQVVVTATPSATDAPVTTEPEAQISGSSNNSTGLLALAQVTKPDFVLLDWDLADRTAGDLIAVLHEINPSIKTMVFSNLEKISNARSAGADVCISKGSQPDIILKNFRHLFEASKLV